MVVGSANITDTCHFFPGEKIWCCAEVLAVIKIIFFFFAFVTLTISRLVMFLIYILNENLQPGLISCCVFALFLELMPEHHEAFKIIPTTSFRNLQVI